MAGTAAGNCKVPHLLAGLATAAVPPVQVTRVQLLLYGWAVYVLYRRHYSISYNESRVCRMRPPAGRGPRTKQRGESGARRYFRMAAMRSLMFAVLATLGTMAAAKLAGTESEDVVSALP
jgi:hypothetical protein